MLHCFRLTYWRIGGVGGVEVGGLGGGRLNGPDVWGEPILKWIVPPWMKGGGKGRGSRSKVKLKVLITVFWGLYATTQLSMWVLTLS